MTIADRRPDAYDPFARGTAPVGVRTISLSDARRGGRRIEVEIWYPAAPRHRGEDLDDARCDRFFVAPGFPEGRQRAVRDAEPAAGCFPLVLHSHCAASHRRDASLLGPHLASHGYVVASPDFPGDTLAEAIADAASAGTGAPPRRAPDEETVVHRPKDALFALEALLAGADPELTGRLDRDRLGTCGISLGGWTSLRLNSLDRRPKATFVAAPSYGTRGPFPQTKLQTSLLNFEDWGRPVPTFLLAGEKDALVVLDDLRDLSTRLHEPKRFAVLRGASHFHWAEGAERLYEACRSMWEGGAIRAPGADLAGLAARTPPFSALAPNAHGTETLQTLCLAHMDAHLKERDDARAWLAGDLQGTFAARGIGLEPGPGSTLSSR